MNINVRARRVELACLAVVVALLCCCTRSTSAAEAVQLHRVIQAKLQGSELGAVARNSKGVRLQPLPSVSLN
jgi:hypothetical protein